MTAQTIKLEEKIQKEDYPKIKHSEKPYDPWDPNNDPDWGSGGWGERKSPAKKEYDPWDPNNDPDWGSGGW